MSGDKVARIMIRLMASTEIRVLVVDDNADFRLLVRRILEFDHAPFACSEASDGWGALQHLRESEADIVLIDYTMPGMDGVELARLITREHPAVDVVLFSAFSYSSDIGLPEKFRAYVPKADLVRLPEIFKQIAGRRTASISA